MSIGFVKIITYFENLIIFWLELYPALNINKFIFKQKPQAAKRSPLIRKLPFAFVMKLYEVKMFMKKLCNLLY